MKKLLERTYRSDNIKDRLKAALILLGLIALFFAAVIAIYYVYQEVQYKKLVRADISKNIDDVVGNQFCIFRYEFDGLTVSEVDKSISDGCNSILRFEEDHVYIPYKNTVVIANYTFTGKYNMKIYNADKMQNLFNSNFGVTLTKRGINITGKHSSLLILADKIATSSN